MHVKHKDQITEALVQEVTEIIVAAIQALEKGQSTAYARTQLKEVARRLQELEFEFRGGCSW